MTKKHMSEKDKKDWDSLYEYVKQLMDYDENQALSKTFCLRLKGLKTNKYIENKSMKDMSNYSYDVVLNTFKYCSMDIKKAFSRIEFKDETHKFNYMLKIVESRLNTIYLKMKNAEKRRESLSKIDISSSIEYINTYKSRNSGNKKQDNLDELW